MEPRHRRRRLKMVHLFLWMPIGIALACLQTASPAPEYLTEIAPVTSSPVIAAQTEEPAGAVVWVSTPARRCVRVIAAEALWLRTGESEHTTSIGYLTSGEVVTLISDVDPDWWLVSRAGSLGYARSSFLELIECE